MMFSKKYVLHIRQNKIKKMKNQKIIVILICLLLAIPLVSQIVLSNNPESVVSDSDMARLDAAFEKFDKIMAGDTPSEKPTGDKGATSNSCGVGGYVGWDCKEVGTELSNIPTTVGTPGTATINKETYECVRGKCQSLSLIHI